jgi:xanthine/CO dehydrogenase XdhC/CoxF family maturation factor
MKELREIVERLERGNAGNGALATLVRVEGSSYRRPGARLLWLSDGTRLGSISGGCLEEDLLVRLRRVAEQRLPELIVYDTTSENDLVWGVGLGCHGIVRVLVEPIDGIPAWVAPLARRMENREPTSVSVVYESPAPELGTRISDRPAGTSTGVYHQVVMPPLSLIVFGAGDDARPLVTLGRGLGWNVTVADCRPAFATRDRFPDASAVVCAPIEELADKVRFDAWTVAVLMTHHYVHDRPVLRAVLPAAIPFVGLLGPKKRAEKIIADLAAEGFALDSAMRERLHAPVGLDLGADGAHEVALSIVAEIQSSLANRNAHPLRQRQGAIHAYDQ